MKSKKEQMGVLIISIWAILVFVVLLLAGAIPQDPAYHEFSDDFDVLSIPNALNVLSNVPFLIVGIMGVVFVSRKSAKRLVAKNINAYYTLFIGVSLVAFGSGYYHLWPDNSTLVWDRLPMTIAFMGLVSIVISEFVSIKAGKALLWPLLVLGLFSVLYWCFTEVRGEGDLRPYIFVQFFPLVGIPIVLLFFRSEYTRVSCYWWLLLAYVAAKLFEHFDAQIHGALGVLSGHSIKHISAAMGVYLLLRGFQYRDVARQRM